MVNRDMSNPATGLSVPAYPGKISTTLGNAPRCGIAIDANDIVNGWLNLYVHVGLSSDLFGEYRLHVYLVEDLFQSTDSIYDQFNDFSQAGPTPLPGNPFFSLPYEINGYGHMRVLRKIINNGSYRGESLAGFDMSAGNEIVSNYRVDLSGLNSGSHTIIAFVDKYGPDGTTHRIENVQFVKVGQVVVWN
jgi:hypothetical protein